MGLLFVLIIWAIVFAILSVGLGLPGLILAHLYKIRTNKEVKLVAWFFAPGVLILSFAGLFFFENIAYSIVTDSDIGIGESWNVNINDKYQLHRFDAWDWRLDTDVNGNFFEKKCSIMLRSYWYATIQLHSYQNCINMTVILHTISLPNWMPTKKSMLLSTLHQPPLSYGTDTLKYEV